MNRTEFARHVFDMSVQAGMNQRYHQQLAAKWWFWDTAAKVSVAFAAVIGAVLSVATLIPKLDQWIIGTSVAVSIVAAFAAVTLNVLPFGTWEQGHRDLFRQWTDLREEVSTLEFDQCDDSLNDHAICELKKLEAKSHRICGQEPNPDDELIRLCYEAEVKSRQHAVPEKAAA